VEELLIRKATPARARALMAAAVRETFEEAGLMIGAPDPSPGRRPPTGWEHFFATGMAPDFGQINYVARAVTPPWRAIRFNARFFMIDARHVQGNLSGGDGELLNLTFVPVAKTQELELALITKRVLELVEDLARNPPRPGVHRTVTLFHHNGKFHDMISE
jgi:8-oxo-dGTP pyrophosphatase MutT (NUDIX family)